MKIIICNTMVWHFSSSMSQFENVFTANSE